MIAGMGIVYFFRTLLMVDPTHSWGTVARFDAILPQDAPKKKPAAAPADDDANVALAIAVALKG